MTIEFIGMIHHRHASEIHPPSKLVLDQGSIRDFAPAAEAGGFDPLDDVIDYGRELLPTTKRLAGRVATSAAA